MNKEIKLITNLTRILQRIEKYHADLDLLDLDDIKEIVKAKTYLGYSTPASLEEGSGSMIREYDGYAESDFKIINRYTGYKISEDREQGKKEYWKDKLREVWSKEGIKGLAPVWDISIVRVGDIVSEIILKDGNHYFLEVELKKKIYENNNVSNAAVYKR